MGIPPARHSKQERLATTAAAAGAATAAGAAVAVGHRPFDQFLLAQVVRRAGGEHEPAHRGGVVHPGLCTEHDLDFRARGDLQVVLSQRLKAQTRARPFDIYRALRVLNPSPFMFFVTTLNWSTRKSGFWLSLASALLLFLIYAAGFATLVWFGLSAMGTGEGLG